MKYAYVIVVLLAIAAVVSIYVLKPASDNPAIPQEFYAAYYDSFLPASTIAVSHPNPAIKPYSVNVIGGDVVISGANWSASFQPQFYLSNGNLLDWSQIPANVQKNLWKIQLSPTKWKYGVDFSNIYTAQKDALQNVVLHRVASENLTWNDVRLEGGCIVVSANQPEVRLCHEDILSTYSIPIINKTDIVIGNLDNTWTVCDSQPITDPDQPYWCAQNHTEGNWMYDTQSGTWSITFDPTITIDAPDVVNDALMSDVVAEGNCSHLAIDYSQAPFTNLTAYYTFDCDKGTNKSTVYDWSVQGQDGSLYGYSTKDPYLEPNGRYGTALNSTKSVWNVESDCVLVPDGALLDFGPSEYFSMSLWIYYNGLYFQAINKHDGSTGFTLLGNDGVGGYWRVTGASDYIFGKIGLNQWHHIVAGRNASQTFVFVDGTYSGGAADASPNDLSNAVDFVLTGDTSPSYKCADSANGMIDEVMIFNKSLSFTEVAEIYNNQSARFKETGTFDYANQSILGGLATGFDTVNVSTEMQNLSASAIGLSVGYYDGLGWGYTSPQNITNHTNYTFTVSATSTNLTLNYTFHAGNISTSWYSPLMFPAQVGDIVVTTETVGGDSAPTSNSPSDASYAVDASATIAWTLTDDLAGSMYNVTRNGTIQNLSLSWTSGVPLAVWVNTTAAAGGYDWNYTIFYNDTSGNNGIPDEVLITITAVSADCWTEDTINKRIFVPAGCEYYTDIRELVGA